MRFSVRMGLVDKVFTRVDIDTGVAVGEPHGGLQFVREDRCYTTPSAGRERPSEAKYDPSWVTRLDRRAAGIDRGV